jgi:hypothetical protein
LGAPPGASLPPNPSSEVRDSRRAFRLVRQDAGVRVRSVGLGRDGVSMLAGGALFAGVLSPAELPLNCACREVAPGVLLLWLLPVALFCELCSSGRTAVVPLRSKEIVGVLG